MKLKIVLQNGWMGDTLLACNVIRNLSDLGHEVVVFHNWPFMRKFIDFIEVGNHLCLFANFINQI